MSSLYYKLTEAPTDFEPGDKNWVDKIVVNRNEKKK